MEKKRSIGVTVLGILGILVGCLVLLMLILESVDHFFTFLPIAIWCICMIIISIALLRRKKWSREAYITLIIILLVIYIRVHSSDFPFKFSAPLRYYVTAIVYIVWLAIVLPVYYYLTRPKVKRAFSERNPPRGIKE